MNNPYAIGQSDQSYGEQLNDQNTEREYTNRIVDIETFMNQNQNLEEIHTARRVNDGSTIDDL
jgi:hypothetical protein